MSALHCRQAGAVSAMSSVMRHSLTYLSLTFVKVIYVIMNAVRFRSGLDGHRSDLRAGLCADALTLWSSRLGLQHARMVWG